MITGLAKLSEAGYVYNQHNIIVCMAEKANLLALQKNCVRSSSFFVQVFGDATKAKPIKLAE